MKKFFFLILFLFITSTCFASLSSTTVWEARTTGSATNGGGFNPAQDSVNGVDYSQQNAAQLTLTDGATTGIGDAVLTSATGGFTHAMEGNIIYIASGTNATVGYYEIILYTDTNTVTLDRAPDDGNGGLTGDTAFKVGGAVDHPYRVGADFITDSTAKIWVKKGVYTYIAGSEVLDATYILTVEGYNATRGDSPTDPDDMPQFDGDGSTTYGVSADTAINCVGYNNVSYGVSAAYAAINCVGYNNDTGVSADYSAINCVGYNNVSYGVSASTAINCVGYNNVSGVSASTAINCVGYNNDTGVSADSAINCVGYNNVSGVYASTAINCVGYNNDTGVYAYYSAINCVGYNNTGYGISFNYGDYNCYYSNGTDISGTAGAHDVNADPLFTNPVGTLIENCEDAWNEYTGTGVTSTADGTIYFAGTYSAKAACTADLGTERVMTEVISSKDMSGYRGITLWVYSSVNLDAGDWQLLLDDTANCASPIKTFNLPAISATTWTPVYLAGGDMSGATAIISIGLYQAVDKGAMDFYIDQVEADNGTKDFTLQATSPCLAAGTPVSMPGLTGAYKYNIGVDQDDNTAAGGGGGVSFFSMNN